MGSIRLLCPSHRNDIVMKECIAYGGVAVHSSPEDSDYEETPQWQLLEVNFKFAVDRMY